MSDDGDEQQERRNRYRFLCERQARLLNLPADHHRVMTQGALDFAFERRLDQMIDTGRTDDLGPFIKLAEMQLTTSPKAPPPQITISFSDEGGPERAPKSETTADAAPPDSGNDPVSSEAAADDANFKAQFPGASRAVPPPKPEPPSYMGSLKAEAKRTGYR